MAPKGKRIKTTANISKAQIASKSTRMKTRVPKELAPRNTPRHARKRTTPSPEPIHIPSPTPSPPSVPSWVTTRLQELAEGKLKIYHERGFLMDEPEGTYRDLYVRYWVTPWGWEKLVEHPTVLVSIKLIHEFVANFPDEEKPTNVLVRGIPVNITPAKINEIFGITYDLDEYDYFTLNMNNSHLPVVHAKIGDILLKTRLLSGTLGK